MFLDFEENRFFNNSNSDNMMLIKLRLNLKLPSAILEADKIANVYKTCDLGKQGKWVKLPKSQD